MSTLLFPGYVSDWIEAHAGKAGVVVKPAAVEVIVEGGLEVVEELEVE